MTETSRLLHDLVALPSVNPMGRDLQGAELFEHRVTDYLERFFRELGASCRRQPVAPLRENIVAWTDLPGAKGVLLFEAHQDTVPTDNMIIDPFGAKIENGRLYGRGACDIKGGMAAMLAAFARIVKEKPAGAANIVMACTVDEEHTFLGVQELVRQGLKADAAIVAEPTQLQIVRAHKGAVRWDLTTKGRACHSSTPEQGVNAVYAMAELLPVIQRFAEQLRSSKIDPDLGPATLSVGRIEGGTSVNTVPDYCRIEIDRRVIPGDDPTKAQQDFLDFLRSEGPRDISFECSPPWFCLPSLSSTGSEGIVARLGAAIDKVRGSHRVIVVPYGTDASTIAKAGVPVVVFGPGDLAQAHTRDEWVDLDEVAQASEILYEMACTA